MTAYQDIRGFDVTVRQPGLMEVLQAFQDLHHNALNLPNCKGMN
jgi:hypothetical protein